MSLISEREQLYLSNWAKTTKSRMAKRIISSESYFEKRTNEETYLIEYAFDTANEMDEIIQKVLGENLDEKLRKVCEVAALKERSRREDEKVDSKQDIVEGCGQEEGQIPEFIYNF